jgi:hypothetical protein
MMGLLSFLGLGRKAKSKPPAKKQAAPAPPPRERSPERQQMEADILANMRKIRQKLAEDQSSPFNGATEEQIMAGLRRWTEQQK